MPRMQRPGKPLSIAGVTFLGLASLAAAMGIGRFAFTPLLPLMQQHNGISLTQGAWLATANYIGYLAGALASLAWMPTARRSMRLGLLAVAIATAAMALGQNQAVWLTLRFLAGAASALVLVGGSAWALGMLAHAGRPDLSGWVFSGVGFGVALAGLVVLAVAAAGSLPWVAWLALGACALGVAIAGWRLWSSAPPAPAAPARAARLGAAQWALVTAYGGFGFGYIIPATFLPAMARTLVADPLIFGWAWPLFGAAAAASTILVTRSFHSTPPRTVAIWSLAVMSMGVLVPALSPTLGAIVVSALCVGGTFMVMTMAGIQEGRRISKGPPARLIAAMTAAFAVGQLLGPVLVSIWPAADNPVLISSVLAAAVLLASALTLAAGPGRARQPPA